ncbi:MAG: translesion error-prone DNA polymerase V autoproteolytic subunit [Parachlamydiales bacterium]|nr:translesion error-prone DNA polymerase V autoproteolytic subunit [Parachlamydiales bacterium]
MHQLDDKELSFFSLAENKKKIFFPFYSSTVPAGFPSPADDYIEQQLDLHELMVKNPAATFFVRVEGESMQNAGIFSGDILVVDRSLNACSGKIVLATLNGEFTVKRLMIENHEAFLVAENPNFLPIPISTDADFQIFGVVTYVIHRAK